MTEESLPTEADLYIRAASDRYEPEYRSECTEEVWSEKTTHVDRMRFASAYGMLTPRQSAAVEAAIREYYEADSMRSVVPLEAALRADDMYFDTSFQPELDENPATIPKGVKKMALVLAAGYRVVLNKRKEHK